MTKGLPWNIQEEIQLKNLIESNKSVKVVAQILNRTPTAIMLKCQRLGLTPSDQITKDALPLPDELPSIEETLKALAGALKAAKEPGLNKVEVQRLQAIANLSRTYKEILSDYINYREIEAKLADMEEKYNALLASTTQKTAPQPAPTPMATTPAQ
jgi:DNA repair ATPase RecN